MNKKRILGWSKKKESEYKKKLVIIFFGSLMILDMGNSSMAKLNSWHQVHVINKRSRCKFEQSEVAIKKDK